jgi:DNA-binding transcriptional MerR regulator
MAEKKNPETSLPDKLYFKVGEVSRIADVPAYVLRFWETEFPRIRPKRTPSGQRMYRRRDVELILEIKRLLYIDKFTIPGARRRLGRSGSQRRPDPQPEDLAVTLTEVREELRRIRDLID